MSCIQLLTEREHAAALMITPAGCTRAQLVTQRSTLAGQCRPLRAFHMSLNQSH